MQKLLNARVHMTADTPMLRDSVRKIFSTPAEVDQLRCMKETMTYCVENFE